MDSIDRDTVHSRGSRRSLLHSKEPSTPYNATHSWTEQHRPYTFVGTSAGNPATGRDWMFWRSIGWTTATAGYERHHRARHGTCVGPRPAPTYIRQPMRHRVRSRFLDISALAVAAALCVSVWADSLGLIVLPWHRDRQLRIGADVTGLIPPSVDGRPTVLIFLDRACSACDKSRGTHESLMTNDPLRQAAHVGVVSVESADYTRQFLGSIPRTPDFVISLNRASFGAKTPTLLVVSAGNRVRQQTFRVLRQDDVSNLAQWFMNSQTTEVRR